MTTSRRSAVLAMLGLAVPVVLLAMMGTPATVLATPPAMAQKTPDAGSLSIVGPDGQSAGACPLKHTDVTADIIGYVSRTTVTQVFENPLDYKIEAVYVFPLPQDAAVDSMVMVVGDRRIVGEVKERGEAREIYEAAKAAGHVASLLDQERPNIFTQSVANIEPGAQVQIEISFVETLKYDEGVFEWVFPMVVGPRYNPGSGSAPAPGMSGTPTPEVPDGDKITPPITPPGTRAGHDISITVHLDAGMELHDLSSELHDIEVVADGPTRATVTLTSATEIPNKDFILHYSLATDEIGDAFLAHHDERGDFFTLVLQPPKRVVPEKLVPRELIFVLDVSGSMNGFPIEKSKAVMKEMIDSMRDEDTFNIITFAGSTKVLWKQPRANTPENRSEAQGFIARLKGGGGTEMMKAINAALVQTRDAAGPADVRPLRIVTFLTDGYVGNDMAIIGAIKENAATTRVFGFGIGNSVNRYLLDGMARAGRGEVEYVTLESQGDAAVERFHERLLAPVLTDIEIDWGDLPVADVYPRQIPDLFSAKPIMVHGRLTGSPEGTITLRGLTGAGAYEEQIRVSTPGTPADHDALASLWARAKVDDLMNRDLAAAQRGEFPAELKQQVIDLGIEFRLMTQFTSFVAVEEMTVTVGGQPTTVKVPVEMPDGVSYEGIFGDSVNCFYSSRRGGAKSMGLQLGGRAMAGGGRMAPPAPPQTVARPSVAAGREFEDDDAAREPQKLDPVGKLDEVLRDLAKKVEKDGTDGNLTVGALKVIDYKVDVMVSLADLSEETLKKLDGLGFVKTGESKAVRLLVGTIDVRKLYELAELDAVLRVKPVGA